jgi:hypothetical protein
MNDSTVILSLLETHGPWTVLVVVVYILARRAPAFLDKVTSLAEATTALVKTATSLAGRLADLAEVGTAALQVWLRERGESGALHDSGEVVIARKVAQGRLEEVRAELASLDEEDSLHGRLGNLARELAELERQAKRAAKPAPKRRVAVAE